MLCTENSSVRHADQTMFFAVVQPVAGATSTNDPLQLVCLDPDQFINALIPTHNSIFIIIHYIKVGGAVVLSIGHQTCDSQVTSSSPG